MAGTYVTNITHSLDSSGKIVPEMPEEARQLASFLVLIIEAATLERSGRFDDTQLRCRSAGCTGSILARMDDAKGEIHWACPVCDHNGVIRNWEGTNWDQRTGQ